MSTTALTTLVGGVVGFFVGGPTGAMYGAQAGFVAGSLLDPPKSPALNGPRLSDLSVQTSTYGAPLPRIYGNVATHGNVIWLQGNKLTEKVKKASQGGKGGGGGTTVKTYSYYATFAVGLADTSKTGPIEGVRRIWVGANLIYDAGSDDLESVQASNQAASGFRVYYGGEDQEPDPRMQADVGVDKCSAFRGVAYIAFYDFPLKNYGNSLMAAQVKVELLARAGEEFSRVQFAQRQFPGYYGACSNPEADQPIVWQSSGATKDLLCYGVSGSSYTLLGAAQNAGSNASLGRGMSRTPAAIVSTYGVHEMRYYQGGVVSRAGLTTSEFLGYSQLRFFIDDSFSRLYVGTELVGVLYVFSPSGGAPILRAETPYAYTSLAEAGGVLFAARFVPSPRPTPVDMYDAGTLVHLGETLPPFSDRAPTFLGVSRSSGRVIAVDSGASRIASWTGSGWELRETDALHGFPPPGFSTPSSAYYDDLTRTLSLYAEGVGPGSDTVMTVARKLSGSGDTLASILQSECLQSGLLSTGDLDTSGIDQAVRGYRVTENGAIRAALEPLQAAWPFDVVQSGYKIKFVRRGKAPVAAIASGELDARPGQSAPGVQIAVSTEMDTQLPRRVLVRYLDVGREYDLSEQEAERLNTDAVNQQAMDLPLVLSATEAAGMAEVLLYLRWLERRDVTITLPPTYRYLEPADVVTVTGDWGSYELRLTRVNLEADGRLSCSAKFNSTPVYTPVAEGAEGEVPEQTVALDGPSRFALLDVPLLSDDLNSPGWPAAMTGPTAGWPGGVIYRSDDGGQTWNDLQAFVGKATIGVGRGVLAFGRTDIVDSTNVLTVEMLSGELSWIDELAQLNGGNLCAYGLPGRWEILAPRTVAQNPDGSLTLSDWLRGRFGTEWAAGLHQAGDVLVLMTDPDLAWVSLNSASIGLPRLYRGVTAGQSISSGDSTSWTYEGVNFKPLSPVYLNGDRHPSTRDWALTWIRRGRISPEWRSGVDVPLGEATEAYDVEIYDGASYATVKRTISVTTVSVGYTSAQQVADFGSNQDTLYVKIYQISATVGRGYPLTAAITRS